MLLSVVLVLALAWPALARRAQPVKVMVHKFGDDNSIPVETEDEDYCQQGDVRYKLGEVLPSSSPCQQCVCVGKARIQCRTAICPIPMCVDYNDDACCTTCPNGLNCWLGGEKLMVGQRKMHPLPNDPYCWKECFCPGASVYSRYKNATQAECSKVVVCA